VPLRIVLAEEQYYSSFRQALDEVAREKIYIEMVEAPPLEKIIDYQMNLKKRGLPCFFALSDDRVVGWADLSVSENPRLQHVGILGMGVIHEFRGRGLGSRLLEQIIESAKSRGLEKLHLTVYDSNQPAIALYRKFGFSTCGLRRNARKLDGQYYHFMDMENFL